MPTWNRCVCVGLEHRSQLIKSKILLFCTLTYRSELAGSVVPSVCWTAIGLVRIPHTSTTMWSWWILSTKPSDVIQTRNGYATLYTNTENSEASHQQVSGQRLILVAWVLYICIFLMWLSGFNDVFWFTISDLSNLLIKTYWRLCHKHVHIAIFIYVVNWGMMDQGICFHYLILSY